MRPSRRRRRELREPIAAASRSFTSSVILSPDTAANGSGASPTDDAFPGRWWPSCGARPGQAPNPGASPGESTLAHLGVRVFVRARSALPDADRREPGVVQAGVEPRARGVEGEGPDALPRETRPEGAQGRSAVRGAKDAVVAGADVDGLRALGVDDDGHREGRHLSLRQELPAVAAVDGAREAAAGRRVKRVGIGWSDRDREGPTRDRVVSPRPSAVRAGRDAFAAPFPDADIDRLRTFRVDGERVDAVDAGTSLALPGPASVHAADHAASIRGGGVDGGVDLPWVARGERDRAYRVVRSEPEEARPGGAAVARPDIPPAATDEHVPVVARIDRERPTVDLPGGGTGAVDLQRLPGAAAVVAAAQDGAAPDPSPLDPAAR